MDTPQTRTKVTPKVAKKLAPSAKKTDGLIARFSALPTVDKYYIISSAIILFNTTVAVLF